MGVLSWLSEDIEQIIKKLNHLTSESHLNYLALSTGLAVANAKLDKILATLAPPLPVGFTVEVTINNLTNKEKNNG